MHNLMKGIGVFNKFFKRISKAKTKHVSTYTKTSRQKLVDIDERFIKWIADVDGDKESNYQYDKWQDTYIFVRIYNNETTDIAAREILTEK